MILVKARKSSRLVEKRVWVKHPKSGKPFQKTVWVLPGEQASDKPSVVQEDLFSTAEFDFAQKESPVVSDPETDDAKIATLIASATPESRSGIQAQVFGNHPQEVAKEPPFQYEPKDIDIPFFPRDIPALSKVIYAKDFSQVPPAHVSVFNKNTMLDQERPSWIPDIPIQNFEHNQWWIPIKENGDGTYDIKWQYSQSAYQSDYGLARVNLDVLVATLDYYSKRVAAERKRYYDAKDQELRSSNAKKLEAFDASHSHEQIARDPHLKRQRASIEARATGGRYRRTRYSMLPAHRMPYSQMAVYGVKTPRLRRSDLSGAWEQYRDLRSRIKQKALDMEIQREEWESSFGKGRETAYGDVGTNDTLLQTHGVMVKRQNGDEISQSEIGQISKAIDAVFSVYGDRSSMAQRYGLKISHAGNKSMHARKAAGIFFPAYHAIGVTAKDGEHQFGFTLAHEWAHFMDHYLGGDRRHFASDDYGSTAGAIASTFRENMAKPQKSDYQNRTCECFARALEQYFATKTGMADGYQADNNPSGNHPKQAVFEARVMPLIERFLRENDGLLKSVRNRMLLLVPFRR